LTSSLNPTPRTHRASPAQVLAALGVVVALGVTACSAGSPSGDAAPSDGAQAVESRDLSGGGAHAAPAADVAKSRSAATILPAAVFDRQVISRADLTVRADDVGRALLAAESAATGVGGFVANERTQADKTGAPQTSTIQLRVPTRSFDDILGELSRLGKLESSNRSSDDVTSQVIDVNSRVRSAREALARIRLLLGRAQDLGDVIRLESELSSRQSDLESLESRQAYFADQTSLATISLTLLSPDAPAPSEPNKDGFFAGLSSGWHALGAAATGLATVTGAMLPFLVLVLLLGIPLALVVRAARRRRQAVPAETTPATGG
jgi:Domain of unknown function (DUF4349)